MQSSGARASAIMASGTLVSRILGFVKTFLITVAIGSAATMADVFQLATVSYTHLTLPTTRLVCRSRWSPYH